MFAIRVGGNRIRLLIEEPILVGTEEGARAEQMKALQALADVISKTVAAYPDQWLMRHSVWGNRADEPR